MCLLLCVLVNTLNSVWLSTCFIFQNNVVQLLETALIDGRTDKVSEPFQSFPVDSLVDLLPLVTGNSGGLDFDNRVKCSLQGIFLSSFLLFVPPVMVLCFSFWIFGVLFWGARGWGGACSPLLLY